MKIKIEDIFYKTILLFPIFTVLIDNGIINKFLFAIIFMAYLYQVFRLGLKRRTVTAILFVIIVMIWSLIQTQFNYLNFNLIFYFPFLILFTYYVIDNKDTVIEWLVFHKSFVNFVLIIWTLIVGVSIFIPSCYNVKEAGELYFGSFAGTIFRLGPAAFFIQALALVGMAIYGNKKYLLYMLVPMYCFLMGSSRTYFVIGTCLFIIAWYWFGVSKKVFYLTVIPLGLLSIFFLINSSLGVKILYTLDPNQYGDFWFRVTSSRSMFWAKDIQAWSIQPFMNRLFGCGLDFTNRVTGLWAHNDFIEVLCSLGILGLIVYCGCIYMLIKYCVPRGSGIPLTIRLMIVLAWLFNACFNMHYTYFCCTLGYPFAVIAVSFYYKMRSKNRIDNDSNVAKCTNYFR